MNKVVSGLLDRMIQTKTNKQTELRCPDDWPQLEAVLIGLTLTVSLTSASLLRLLALMVTVMVQFLGHWRLIAEDCVDTVFVITFTVSPSNCSHLSNVSAAGGETRHDSRQAWWQFGLELEVMTQEWRGSLQVHILSFFHLFHCLTSS